MDITIPKGVALMIRALLNIDPEKVEGTINDLLSKSEAAFNKLNSTLAYFDERLLALEAANKVLQADNQRLISLIERLDHGGQRTNGYSATDNDHSITG